PSTHRVPHSVPPRRSSDLATFRPSTGIWYILRSSDGRLQQVTWGAPGDVPVTGDFDGDGKTDVATFRPSAGIWYILRSSDGAVQDRKSTRLNSSHVAISYA